MKKIVTLFILLPISFNVLGLEPTTTKPTEPFDTLSPQPEDSRDDLAASSTPARQIFVSQASQEFARRVARNLSDTLGIVHPVSKNFVEGAATFGTKLITYSSDGLNLHDAATHAIATATGQLAISMFHLGIGTIRKETSLERPKFMQEGIAAIICDALLATVQVAAEWGIRTAIDGAIGTQLGINVPTLANSASQPTPQEDRVELHGAPAHRFTWRLTEKDSQDAAGDEPISSFASVDLRGAAASAYETY